MAQHAGNPLLVYFIEMAIQQMKSGSLMNADAGAGGERADPLQSGFAQFD